MLKSLGILLLVGMATTSVFRDESGDPEDNALQKEFPNRADTIDDDFIDQSDLFNYDLVTRTMRNRKEKKEVIDMTLLEECRMDLVQCRQNLVDFHEKSLLNAMYDKHKANDKVGSCQKELLDCHADFSDCKIGCNPQVASPAEVTGVAPCGGEQAFFRRFARSFIKMLITETEQHDTPLAAEVKVELQPYHWNKLRQFAQQKGKVKLVDAHDIMTDMLVSVHHENIIQSSWLERLTGMELNDIKFYSMMVVLSIIVVVFESKTKASWRQQLCVVFVVLFIISVGWNWLYLYKKELSKRLAEVQKMEGMPNICKPYNMSWWDAIKEVFRKQMTFQDDPCFIYHEKYLVDPIYEVAPTRALSHTIAIMFFEPLQHIGKAIGEFHKELLKDLPYAAWIPALLFPYLAIALVVIMLCYCPSQGQTRNAPLLDCIRRLEVQLEKEKAINQRLNKVEALEMPQQLALRGYHKEPVAGQRPPCKVRPRHRFNSDSDLQHRQQRKPITEAGVGNVGYQGDVSGGSDSSDETDSQLRLGQDPVNRLQTSPPRLAKSVTATKSERKTVVQGKPVESPISEVDSFLGTTAKPSKKPTTIGRMDSLQASGEASGPVGASGAHKARNSRDRAGGDVMKDERDAAGSAPGKELEAKVSSKEKSLKAPSTLTPSSSTDSEVFLATPQGCDSPSSVSVIEGDSSPMSGGSVDGDSHLQGLGMSLSGSIDVIQPQEVLEGQRVGSDNGPDSDEFEVLSREQCQTESVN